MTKLLVMGLLLLLGAAQVRADEILGGFDTEPPLLFKSLSHEAGQHVTVATIADVTDPANPHELWRGSNTLTLCGVLNLLTISRSGVNYALQNLTGATAVCSGSGSDGATKISAPYDSNSTIFVGAANNTSCTASAIPWPCCSGNGTGLCNTATATDVITFTEGQPGNGQLAGVEGFFNTWVDHGRPNGTQMLVDTLPQLYYDTVSTSGMTFVATADGSTANHSWCEYSVRSAKNASGYGLAYSGGTWRSGWSLNHAIINPCLTKGAGSIWQIRVQITIS